MPFDFYAEMSFILICSILLLSEINKLIT